MHIYILCFHFLFNVKISKFLLKINLYSMITNLLKILLAMYGDLNKLPVTTLTYIKVYYGSRV